MPLIKTEYSIGDEVVDRSNYYDDSGVIKKIVHREGKISAIEITPVGIYYVITGKGSKWKMHENRVRRKEYTSTRSVTSRTS